MRTRSLVSSQSLLQLYGNSSWCLKLGSLSFQPVISLHYIAARSPLHCSYCSFQEDTETAASEMVASLHSLILNGGTKLSFPEVSSLGPGSPQLIWQVLECLCPQLEQAGKREDTGTFQGLGYKQVSAQQEGQGTCRKLRS